MLGIPGAIESDDSGVALHYGQPIAEARLLEEGRAFVDLSHRGVVTVSGPDRLTWLDSMTSQLLRNLPQGESTETLLLSPQGRIEQLMRVYDDGSTTWLLVDEGRAEPTAAYLNRMRFALRVEVADVTSEYAQIAVFDGEALTALRQNTEPVLEWRDPWAQVQRGGYQYSAPRTLTWDLSILLIPRAALESMSGMVTDGSVRVAGLAALNALEIRAWRVGVADVDDRTLPHELDWTRTAVHLDKGCYRGQEAVAKVHNLGHPPRRLAMLHIDGTDGETPEQGALIYVEDKERPVGRVTRAALHHDWGVIALAMLKRSTSAEAALQVELASGGRGYASQEVIVPIDAGATRDIPKLRRL